MVDYIAKYEPAVEGPLRAAFYRVLGISSFPADIKDITEFVKAEVDRGKLGGEIEWVKQGSMLWWFIWRNINMSAPEAEDPITFDCHIWGRPGGINTVFTREAFYKMYVFRGALEKTMRLEKFSLAPGKMLFRKVVSK